MELRKIWSVHCTLSTICVWHIIVIIVIITQNVYLKSKNKLKNKIRAKGFENKI